MSFNIYLDYPKKLLKTKMSVPYNPRQDDVIWRICEVLNKNGDIEFRIDGFKKDEVRYNWNKELSRFNLTTDWDLAMAMEQIPSVIKSLNENNYSFSISFYEEGSEFNLLFEEFSHNLVKVKYESYNHKAPINSKPINNNTGYYSCVVCASSEAFIKKESLKKMMIKLYKDFIFVSERLCGNLLEVKDDSIQSFLNIKHMVEKGEED